MAEIVFLKASLKICFLFQRWDMSVRRVNFQPTESDFNEKKRGSFESWGFFGGFPLQNYLLLVGGKSTTSWGHWKRCMMLSKTFKSYSYIFFLLWANHFWCLQYKHFISTYACFSLVWSFDLRKSVTVSFKTSGVMLPMYQVPLVAVMPMAKL